MLTSNAANSNLRLLCVIRAIVLSAELLALLYASQVMQLELAYAALLFIWLLFTLLTVATVWQLRSHRAVTPTETFVHLLADSLLLSGMLYFSGGANNPFVSYFLVPISIAAATLPWRLSWTMVILCAAAYSVLLFFYIPLPELQPHGQHGGGLSGHIIGMWANFLLSAVLITYFVVKMARSLQQREQEVHAHRERELQNEQLLAVATLAAGTAHELGTPLSTVAITLDEMENEVSQHPTPSSKAQLASIQLLQQQIDSCRASLRKLVDNANADEFAQCSVTAMLDELLSRWRLIRPETPCTLSWHNQAVQSWQVATPPVLQQALLNLLNNAADAVEMHPQRSIDIQIDSSPGQVHINLYDRGPGIAVELADNPGNAFTRNSSSDKHDGWGIGLFLSHATLQRLGGTISLYNRSRGGTRTQITLPAFPTGKLVT
ncbi:MAG: ATP-binding protein [Pseudomonadales bacterium]